MRIGICASEPEHIRMAQGAGFDFVEVNTVGNVMNDEKYPDLLELRASLPDGFMYSCNILCSADLRLTGPDVDYEKIRAYCAKSFARLDSLGIKMIVFGSSAAKRVPEGFSMDEAMDQLTEAVRIFSEAAAMHSQRVCIEPIRFSECNIINTALDAAELVRRVDRENVGLHVDYFHMMQNGEKLSQLVELAPMITHTHIASPCKRSMPTFDDGADYAFFFETLRKGGYDETVTFEGSTEWDADLLCRMCEYLRSASAHSES